MKLNGISLETDNVEKLVNFYEKLFDVKAEGSENHYVLKRIGIAIWKPNDTYKLPKTERNFYLMFEVEDVDLEYNRLKNLNVEFILLPTTQPWGTRSMRFKDPDGNKIDFYSNKKNNTIDKM